MSKTKIWVIILIVAAILISSVPLFILRDAEFVGTDDTAGAVVDEITGGYEPWLQPVAETVIGGEIPGEVESLLFCIQTAIGVGVLAFFMGRMVERKKYTKSE